MPEYPTDLDLNETKDIYLSGANDLALVSGPEQRRQSAAIDAMDEIKDFFGSNFTGADIGQLEQALTEGFEDDPQLASVQSVTIQSFDPEAGRVTATALVIGDDDFTFEVME